MDPPANYQNPNDLHWFPYFEETPPLPRDDHTMEHRSKLLDNHFEMLDHPNQLLPPWPLELDQNYISDELGFQDFDPIEDLSLWDWWDDHNSLSFLTYNHNPSDVITDVNRIDHNVTSGEANISSSTAAADHGGRKRGRWDDDGLPMSPFFSCNDGRNYVISDVKLIDHYSHVTNGEDDSATDTAADHGGRKWDSWDDSLPLLISCRDDDRSADFIKPVDHDYHHVTSETTNCCIVAAGGDHGGRKPGRRSKPLELEEIEKLFEMPITMAAKELNVGLTVLKKRCRELNIKRWPHRKLKSLKSLMHNVKEMGLEEEMEMLEENKRMMEKLPEMELTQRTKKLRQAFFKFNYKKRRLLITNYN